MIEFKIIPIEIFDLESEGFFDCISIAHVVTSRGEVVERVVALVNGDTEGSWGVVDDNMLCSEISEKHMRILQVLPRTPATYLPLHEYYKTLGGTGPCDMEY